MTQVSVPDNFTYLVSLLWSSMDEVDFDLWLAMFTRRAASHFGFEPPEYELLNYGERSAEEVLIELELARSELRLAVEELRSARATLPDATPEQLAELESPPVVSEPPPNIPETIPEPEPIPVAVPMSALEPPPDVRTLTELLADDGSILPLASIGQVIGHSGDRLVVTFEDLDTGETLTVEANPWELRPAVARP